MTSTGVLVPTNGAAATQLALELGAELRETSLVITDAELSIESWQNIGRCIGVVGNAWQWWVGDWLNFGEGLFGEESAQGVDDQQSRYDIAKRITPVDQGRLQNIRSVCGRVAASRRRVELTFSHHEEVAALDADDQNVWLQRAIDAQWTKAELRQAIKDEKNPPIEVLDPEPTVSDPGPSIADRLEEAARLVYRQGQTTSGGDYLVPASAMAQLAAALGEES